MVSTDAILRLLIALAITLEIDAQELAVIYADERAIVEYYNTLLLLTSNAVKAA